MKNPTDTPPAAATVPGWRAKWAAFPSRLKPRRKMRAEPRPAAGLGAPLRAFRAAALWSIALVVAVADGAAFTESYKGLFDWAENHDLSGFWAAAFPLSIDLFIVVAELVLFIAMTDQWDRRDRLGAWTVGALGLAVSVAGNIGHVHAHDLQSRGTAAVPPVAAFTALWLGLGVLKRILRHRQEAAAETAQVAQAAAERDVIAAALDELSGAVMLLARRDAEPAPVVPDHSVLLREILAAVRDVAEYPAGALPAPVPADAESAALASYRATFLAGNPWSQRQMETRFGTTRGQFARMRDSVHAELHPGGPEEAPPFTMVPRLRRLGEDDELSLNGSAP